MSKIRKEYKSESINTTGKSKLTPEARLEKDSSDLGEKVQEIVDNTVQDTIHPMLNEFSQRWKAKCNTYREGLFDEEDPDACVSETVAYYCRKYSDAGYSQIESAVQDRISKYAAPLRDGFEEKLSKNVADKFLIEFTEKVGPMIRSAIEQSQDK